MNEMRTLLENYWICKDTDKEAYYKVKSDIPRFQRFLREQLGWKLIHTEHLLKLEKIPAHAESFMGIQEFQEISDYCILCAVLMYLEDKEEQEQFLLSELIDFVETQLKASMEIDWTSFSQRKSLVRVLQFMERLSMLRVYEGSSEAFGQEAGQEVLYENTGYSKYFATSFAMDIASCKSWMDFERVQLEELAEDRGRLRVNRVYRQLVACPGMFWETNEDADSLYLKNQRQWVAKYLEEHLGGRLDIHRNVAFWMVEEEDCYGRVHPREAQLSELVTLLCGEIRDRVEHGSLKTEANECIYMSREEFANMVWECRETWKEAWSKEYREMDGQRLLKNVLEYMEQWMMLRADGGAREPGAGGLETEGLEAKGLESESLEPQEMAELCILPSAGKTAGFYPADYQTENAEKRTKDE